MHSPFVYHFIREILNDKKEYEAYERVEGLRRQLLNNSTVLSIEDLGAGSTASNSSERSISEITRRAAKPRKLAQLIYRVAQQYQPATVIELGTSMGISTAYLASACPASNIITIEGSPAIAQQAATNFQSLKLSNIQQHTGNFDEVLPAILQQQKRVDLAFIDGNHRLEPTLRYFEQLLPALHSDSILIFDDIHWSRDMEEAWSAIKAHPQVRCTIDLFFLGFVFFRKEFKEKVDFAIRF